MDKTAAAEAFRFLKTGAGYPNVGTLIGAAAGLGMQARRLKGKGESARMRQLKLEIAKQELELKANPSPTNLKKLEALKAQHHLAGAMKRHPRLAMLGSGVGGALIGRFFGKRFGQ